MIADDLCELCEETLGSWQDLSKEKAAEQIDQDQPPGFPQQWAKTQLNVLLRRRHVYKFLDKSVEANDLLRVKCTNYDRVPCS